MKKIFSALVAIAILSPACTIKTVFYDVNPDYESHVFGGETIAVCPFSGMWKIEGDDTVFNRVADNELYAEAVARQIGKGRKCLSVINPEIVAQKVPEIESFLFKHKYLYRKTGITDSSAFNYLHGALGADYVLFFESIYFNNEEQKIADSVESTNNTILVFQLWDLKNRQFMYRGETKGSGEAGKGGRAGAGNDPRSSKWCVQNTAVELVRSLPMCK